MFQAVITLVLNSTMYFRKTVLAYVPSDGAVIDVPAEGEPTLGLKVTQVRNRIGKTESGLAVRVYPLPDDKLKLPKTDGDSRPRRDQLRQMSDILRVYGFEPIPSEVVRPPEEVVRSGRIDLRITIVSGCTITWLSKADGKSAGNQAVTAGYVLGDLHCISQSEDYDDSLLIETEGRYAHIQKANVTVPQSQSVRVKFLTGIDFNWTRPDGVLVGDHFDKNTTHWFKAVLANPLNPEQVAFVLPDNRFAVLSNGCFEHIDLPAGDLRNLPKFQKPKPPADTVKPLPHVYGWLRFKQPYFAETQLADDTVTRKFDEGDRVMVRTLVRDVDDILGLRLVDGHLWHVPSNFVEKSEIPLWIQMRVAKTVLLQVGAQQRAVQLLAGSRILVRNMSLTPMEADLPGPGRNLRTFELDHATTFQLHDGAYEIGQTQLHAHAVTPDSATGLTNIFFKIPETITKVATISEIIDQVKIPAGEYLARLVEVDATRVVITMPNFTYFWVPKDECTLIGGHATADPQNNAPYHNAVYSARQALSKR